MEGMAGSVVSPLNFLGSDTLSKVQSRRLVFPMIESNTQFRDEEYRWCMHSTLRGPNEGLH